MPLLYKLLKHAFTLVTCFLTGSFLYAQSTIQINQLPVNPFSFGSKDLWQVNIVNSGAVQQVVLKAQISSLSGTALLDAISQPLRLEQGLTTFTPVNVQTAGINYYQSSVQQTDMQQKSLPAGNYTYCISVVSSSGAVLGQSCQGIELTPVTPPILVLPAYDATLDHKLPFFSWLPPIPASADMQYTLLVAEMRDQQMPEDAVLRNPPVYSSSGIGISSLQYPVTAYALQKGKSYAWQVKAYNPGTAGEKVGNDMMAGNSEVFVFHIPDDSIPQPKVETPFAVLNQFNMESSTTMVKYLKFIYYEAYEKGQLQGVLTDEGGRTVTGKPLQFTSKNGENAYEVDLTPYNLSEEGIYKLNITTSHRESFVLQFTFRYAQ